MDAEKIRGWVQTAILVGGLVASLGAGWTRLAALETAMTEEKALRLALDTRIQADLRRQDDGVRALGDELRRSLGELKLNMARVCVKVGASCRE